MTDFGSPAQYPPWSKLTDFVDAVSPETFGALFGRVVGGAVGMGVGVTSGEGVTSAAGVGSAVGCGEALDGASHSATGRDDPSPSSWRGPAMVQARSMPGAGQ